MRKWTWPDIQDIVVETDSSPPRQRVRLCDSQGRKTTLPHLGRREHMSDIVQAIAGLLSHQQTADLPPAQQM
ncbi:hypothetical protein [Streptomyces puniciscabiei]|uniref:hypothetical protein n=1 Tax=Streptomyces puniciscabiei TaxID=164348 RepID=UPI0037B729F5